MSQPKGRGDRGGRGRGINNFRGPPRGGFGRGSKSDDERPTPAKRGQPDRGRGAYTRGAFSRGGGQFGTKRTSILAQDDFTGRLAQLRAERPQLKQQLIDMKLMNPDGQMNLKDAVQIRGLCNDMCPEFERVRRIVENDMKLPEYSAATVHGDRKDRLPDEAQMVKAFARSAAGVEVELPTDIRSPATCLKTLDHMLKRLDHEPIQFLYTWMWDRTRAIRKDLGCQTIDPEDVPLYLACLEQCVRFHLLTLHHMSNADIGDYNRQQDLQQLGAAAVSLRYRYDDNRKANIISPNEAEFRACMLIVSLHTRDKKAESELHSLPSSVKQNGRFKTAWQIYKAGKTIIDPGGVTLSVAQQNWKNFWDLVFSPSVPYLMACASEITFQNIRHSILDAIYRAYRQVVKGGNVGRDLSWSTHELRDALGFDSTQQVKSFCADYGFSFAQTESGECLDFSSKVFLNGRGLGVPQDQPLQIFSQRVEAKRYRRSYSAVIKGFSVKEAMSKGLCVDAQLPVAESESNEDLETSGSLFVPERPTTTSTNVFTSKPPAPRLNPFAGSFTPKDSPSAPSNGTSSGPGISNPFSVPNAPPGPSGGSSTGFAFKNPFQTATSTATTDANGSSNPFALGANKPASAIASATNDSTTTGLQPSTSSSTATATAFSNPSTVPSMTTNGGWSTTSPATGQKIQPGLFDPSKSALKFSPQADASGLSSVANVPTPQPPKAPTFPATSTWPSKPASTTAASPFALSTSGAPSSPFFSQPVTSAPATTSGTFTFASQQPLPAAAPLPPAPSQEEERQRKLQEEQLRLRQEEQRRKEEQRQAEEQRRIRAAEEQRRIQAQRQEEQRQALEVQRRRREIDSAYEHLANNLLMDSDHGLMRQFVESVVADFAIIAQETVLVERAEAEGRRRQEQKLMQLKYSCLTLWRKKLYDKQRAAHARSRRKWLRENADMLLDMKSHTDIEAPAAADTRDADKVKDSQRRKASIAFKKPTAPASSGVQHHNRPRKQANSAARSTPSLSHTASSLASSSLTATFEQKMAMGTLYKNPNPRVDRTETDWFELRAMGIDPSKHRKRSLSIESDEENNSEGERKRSRISSTSIPRQALAPQTGGDIMARLQAVKESLGKSISPASSPAASVSVDIRQPTSAAPYSDLLSRAKAQVQYSTPDTPNIQHEFGRSVPDLSLRHSSTGKPTFSKSVAATSVNKAPAYWARTSRFVPRHLYGQGADAVMVYRQQLRGSISTSPGPLQLSSPIPTQQSYLAGQAQEMDDADVEYESGEEYSEDEYGEESYGQDVRVQQGYADEEDYDEVDGEGEGSYYEDQEDEEEEMEDDGVDNEQFAQQPGGTENDAIELSD